MRTKTKNWNVMFAGDHFVLTTTVEAKDEEQAEREAVAFLESFYGWDVESVSHDIEVELCE